MDISFVIIGKNEAFNIKRCITSIKSLDINYKYEIIYIDSNSSDDSKSIAKDIDDIRFLVVKSNFYSAGLSRNIGASLANGKYIFFLDGDMEIQIDSDINFIIEYMQKNRNCKIVSGKLNEIIYGTNNEVLYELPDRYFVDNEIEELNEPGGVFIVDKCIFEDVGGFNPIIRCNEELQLYSMIKLKYDMIRTNKLICIHHDRKNEHINEQIFINRFKDKYFTGCWITLVECLKKGVIKEYFSFKYSKEIWIKNIVCFSSIILFILGILNRSLIYVMQFMIIFSIFMIKERSFLQGFYKYREYILRFISFIFINKLEIDYEVTEE